MLLPSRRSSLLGWAGPLLCLLALIAVAVPSVGYVRALEDKGLSLSDGPQSVSVPHSQSFGIYVDDADNSGYSENCSATEANGHRVQLDDPPWSISFSDTETLDLVVKAEPGDLTISCAVPGEEVTLRPLPNNRSLLIGIVLAALFGCGGVGLILAWTTQSSDTPTAQFGTSYVRGADTDGPWIPAEAGGHVSPAPTAALTAPSPVKGHDLIPAIVAVAVGIPVLAMSVLRWLAHLFIVSTAWDDPELWNGNPPVDGSSVWQVAQSTWTQLIPVAIGVALVVAAWRLAWRDRTVTAWVVTGLALAVSAVSFVI